MQSMWTGLDGVNAASQWLNAISGNIANLDSVGYASQNGSFADTLTRQLSSAATAPSVASRYTLPGYWGGSGAYFTQPEIDFSQMPIQATGNTMDAAISGPGFFTVQSLSGQTLLTKAGNFIWSKQPNGSFALSLPDGSLLLDTQHQPIIQPNSAASMSIGKDGQIFFNGKPGPKLNIVQVAVPSQSLIPQSNDTYAIAQGWKAIPSPQSTVLQGYLSQSNVNITNELAKLMQAQELYSLNAQSLKMSNQMMGIANTIL